MQTFSELNSFINNLVDDDVHSGKNRKYLIAENCTSSRTIADFSASKEIEIQYPKNQITSLLGFGDSLSDTGNLSTLTYLASGGQFWFPPSPPLQSPNPLDNSFNPFGGLYYEKDPYYNSSSLTNPPQVRASNGPIWADIFPAELGLDPTQVNNYAYAGATTGTANGLQPFLPAALNTLPLPGLLDEIDYYKNDLSTGKVAFDPTALNVVWAGANDGFNLAGLYATSHVSNLSMTLPSIGSAIKTAVDNIEMAIESLEEKGAKIFLAPDLPDLGKTPLLSKILGKDSAFVGTVFSLAFDIESAVKLTKLEHSDNINIVQPDVYALFEEATKHPQEFGFTNVTDPVIAQDPNNSLVKPSEYLFYDYQHPTTDAQKAIADLFQDNLFKAGYVNQGPPKHLPDLKGSLLDKEISLVLTLGQGIPDLTPSDLIKDLFVLIPDAISATPHLNTITAGSG